MREGNKYDTFHEYNQHIQAFHIDLEIQAENRHSS